jgi:predicted MFS family arabinose efflux permease
VTGPKPAFDFGGAILSALAMAFVVIGILQASTYGWFTATQDFVVGNTVLIPQGGISPVWLFVAAGLVFLVAFYLYIRYRERAGREPLLSTRLFKNRTSNLGLLTQNIQWLILMGISFVVSVFLQVVLGYSAIQTGLVLTPATVGILASSTQAARLAQRRSQKTLVVFGFLTTLGGVALLLLLARADASILLFAPGLLFIGLGVGVMLTSSVNVVQSAFPDSDQGEISGLSRSISNLGSSLGTAIAGSVLIATVALGNLAFALALIVLMVLGLVGLGAALLLPADAVRSSAPASGDGQHEG